MEKTAQFCGGNSQLPKGLRFALNVLLAQFRRSPEARSRLGPGGHRGGTLGWTGNQPSGRSHMTPWTLEVQRSEFMRALKVVVAKASQAAPQARALLTFSDGQLSIAVPGSSAEVPAAGNWPGEARVPAFFLGRLARTLPDDDPLRLGADGKNFSVSRLSIPCECRLPEAVETEPRLSQGRCR